MILCDSLFLFFCLHCWRSFFTVFADRTQRADCFGQRLEGPELKQPQEAVDFRRWGIPFLLVVYAVLLAINTPTYHAFGRFDPYHEGESLGSAISYLAGRQPYRDFVFFHGLIQDPLRSVWAFEIFGKSIGSQRAFESMAKVVLWVLLAFFLDRLFQKKTWIVLSVLSFLAVIHVSFFFNVFGTFLMPSLTPDSITQSFLSHRPFWEGFNLLILTARDGLTFAFLCVFLEVHGILAEKRRSGKWRERILYFFLAFIPFASLGYSIDRGVYLTATYVLLAPVLFFFITRSSNSRKDFVLFSFGGILTAFFLLEWLLKGKLLDCLRFIFFIFPSYKALSEKIPYPIHEWKFLFALLLVSAQVFALIWNGLRARSIFGKEWMESFLSRALIEMTLTLISVFSFFNVLVRSDEEHLLYGLGVPYILALFVIFKKVEPWMQKHIGVRRLLGYACFVAVASILAAGVIRDIRWKALQKNFPLETADSAFIPPEDRAAILFLKSEMKPGDEFFTMTSEASWYYYLDKPCPTRFPYIWTAAPEAFQRDINQDLLIKKVKWVLFRDDDWSGRIDDISNEEKFPVVARFIRENYHPFQNIAGREIWVLNGR